MGKIRTRIIGLEHVEEKQKKQQKVRSEKKKKTILRPEPVEGLRKGKEKEKVEVTEVKKKPAVAEAKTGKTKKKNAVSKKKRGKKYQASFMGLEVKNTTVVEAVSALKKIKYASFDESVEIHLNVDEMGLKGEVELPHSTGKTVRVRIVDDTLLDELSNGKIEFDILITHPSFMPKLAKYARTLGPKGLMPNPKAGTISPKPEEVAKKFEKGILRWKTETKFPLIHQMMGKISFEEDKLAENIVAFLVSVGKTHIQSAYVKTTMSPSVKLDLEKVLSS